MVGLALRLALVVVLARDTCCVIGDVTFSRHPSNRTASQGNGVRLGCAVEGPDEPDVVWVKDGSRLRSADQMFIALGEKHWETYHSVKSVQQQDAGQYWCEVDFHGRTFASRPAWITVEGVPHFVLEPQDVATLPGEPFNLTCGAVGPPEPVEVLWWLGGVREGGAAPSPSVLRVAGVNGTLKFYCEARNARGISVSRTGTVYIKELPAAPVGLEVAELAGDDVSLSWQPGFTGHSELSACVVQLRRTSPGGGTVVVFPGSPVQVPPHASVLPGLSRHSNYSVRVACLNEVGASPFSAWTGFVTAESVGSLGISEDLNNQLKDVLIPERLLTLGHVLGKGEFGSVREASLKTDDSRVQKVAVKALKSDMASSGDVEQFLREAAHMKDFHHPNVIRLIGVSLRRRHARRLPVPVVVLPFMRHGDLHTFLLLSRLGDRRVDFSAGVLVRFMLDVARGMEYLSARNIIHRDLAARNCMLDENMAVRVADFGLSKKINPGDYYRQGSVAKLPVKWIALESLADNVYTTQSDVWAFGVTMWEVMTRGQTPYPGVENSEIYEYLIRGERLKKPAECAQDVYDVMHSCWSPVPKCRPTFRRLAVLLEELRLSFSPAPPHEQSESFRYVNLAGAGEGREGNGAGDLRRAASPWVRETEAEAGEGDWPRPASGAVAAIGGGDYRYVEELGGTRGGRGPGVDRLDDDDDAVVHV
ncbi:tyrosine-protein kinase receptor TYRO3 isoform X2 [Syngnathoides biaculeatus]|uniref:tyrosine-protein kinase receptor TYRO3 isoform X2 n=1 Tax=Syngnathoides biaculeatus TaxID=300417 RepID=UPI002ADE30E5|nr:tyrosine-protein kinase receptor TYRO3 isoform X2 [Syngnathoides biaculeatus]